MLYNFTSVRHCILKHFTFIDTPQSRVGAHVLYVAWVDRIHLYDEPIICSERSRQKSEAENPAHSGCDHQITEAYFHGVHVRVYYARNDGDAPRRQTPKR